MTALEKRDNEVYRSIFEANPLPDSARAKVIEKQQELDKVELKVDKRAAATIMAASRGYPTGYEKGYEISGLDDKYGKQSIIFQAGTKQLDGKIVTNGGRVLCVTSLDKNLTEAVHISLDILDHINYEGMYYRTDIGFEFK